MPSTLVITRRVMKTTSLCYFVCVGYLCFYGIQRREWKLDCNVFHHIKFFCEICDNQPWISLVISNIFFSYPSAFSLKIHVPQYPGGTRDLLWIPKSRTYLYNNTIFPRLVLFYHWHLMIWTFSVLVREYSGLGCRHICL